MNFKKTLYLFIFFVSITPLQFYTQESQDDNQSRATMQAQDSHISNQTQFNDQIWKYIEEAFQTVIDQTQKIEFSLQTVEQIINAGKVKFDADNKTIKNQLLQEIKEIRSIISMIQSFYSKEMSKDEAIIKGSCFNQAFIAYLLPVLQNDFTKLTAKDFDTIVLKNYETIINKIDLKNPNQIEILLQITEKQLNDLISASENVGLSTLNKIYRYLNTKPLPWYGKSTIATAQDAATWGSLALLAYSLAVWGFRETTNIYGTSQKIGDLPLKRFFGDWSTVSAYNKTNMDPEVKNAIAKNFGIYDHAYNTNYILNEPVVAPLLATMAWLGKDQITQLYREAQKKYNRLFNYYIKGDVTSAKKDGEPTKTYFSDMIGGAHLEQIARELTDYLKNPNRYERGGFPPPTGYLLVGPSQTGKSLFAKGLKTMVDEAFEGTNEKVKFINITHDDMDPDHGFFGGFANLFYWAERHAPIIIFIDEIDTFGLRRDRNPKLTQELLTGMNGIETNKDKKVIVIAATNRPEELDFALKQKGRFGEIITFDYPTYESRKQYIEKQLFKKNINISPEMIDTIAQETHGQTYNMLDDIINKSLRSATYQMRPTTEADFEATLDYEIRKIKQNVTISTKEKELIAIYQAGQAAARHILKTEQEVVKITIETVERPIKSKEGFGVINELKDKQNENYELLPQTRTKQTRLGYVFTISKSNNHELTSDTEQEKEILALLSGQAALELIKGSTYNNFGKEDRAKVLDMLERKIAQGTPITDEIHLQAIAEKDRLYVKAKEMLKKHLAFVQTIKDALLKNTTITTKQWLALAANYNV
ncbi:MAG: AAA family ATPase [Candidatus Chromulinivorax sp.]